MLWTKHVCPEANLYLFLKSSFGVIFQNIKAVESRDKGLSSHICRTQGCGAHIDGKRTGNSSRKELAYLSHMGVCSLNGITSERVLSEKRRRF